MGGKYGSHPGPTTHSSDAEAVELEASGVQSMSHTCDGTTRLAPQWHDQAGGNVPR
ncbi:hypothetical protein FOMPIDRAFT_1026630 [Fomitopsis schrenkii]|uniref:Uncharacterized protein n=1 Tax=Fomitopsis schrenkii TaxID=2126942 RepID=S8DP67_FOMSC|nr:hypothetical protein FOMPIDRAFT_1026630 [Fomitopsis schrenkii]